MIGNAIGRGNMEEAKREGRTLSVIDLIIGAILGLILFLLHKPLLSMYSLTPEAYVMADQLLVLMAFLMVTMGYMMPVMNGILRGGGDAKFTLYVNMISTWAVVVPLSFMSAFWWKLPVVWVVFFSQSDQVFKAPIAFLRFRTYKWAKKLTRDN
jgi:Na+-driven multidrug efflux pump